ncbi:MAG: oxygen-independent coproporphyrinogen III oxidase [Rhizobiales bacterium NRL2]|jgi:oxygen-independent coproporphyrinogen-3 oxidase|nr:MAG: oxygen-independent coproporphyrinogen III oxidase [Rhizobiales bacterium NRL2]
MSANRTALILAHADKRIPRYTSYPTAPHFGPGVTQDTYRTWLSGIRSGTPVSLYVHVPFCRTMCWYCGCNTRATLRNEPLERYLDTLEMELNLLSRALPSVLPLKHLHWGGGSPSLVRAARFRGIMQRIRRSFAFKRDAEVALEVDPRHLCDELVDAMAETGVNRVSLGVQTFDEKVQRAINRVQPFETVADAFARLRAGGIEGVNADLLYGLPLQTVDGVIETTDRLLELTPDRISVFGYAHVPHMKPHQRMIREEDLPDAAGRLAQADAIAERLVSGGYRQIGLDHFARADDPMARALESGRLRRNFQGYTTDEAPVLLGVGASAIGSLPEGYVQNDAATENWRREIIDGRFAIARGLALDGDDRMRREIIERIMCDLTVDLAALAAAHGRPAPEADLAALEADGIVRRDGDRIVVAEAFRPLSRVVAAAFDARLNLGPARHAVAV